MSELDERQRKIVLRILDANVNRCAEGLRVIEEVARFDLSDRSLQRRLKGIRHAVRHGMDCFTGQPFRARDSETDIGRDSSSQSEMRRGSLESVLRANFARSEEALRVIEEFGKLLDETAASGFKGLRFELYGLEREFFGPDVTGARMPSSPFIYAILDRDLIEESNLDRTVMALVEGGVGLIQYRAKGWKRDDQRRDLVGVLAVAESRSVPVIVNDDPGLAAEVGAHGVHLGEDDPPPAEARALLGPSAIIGATVHSLDEFERLSLEVVDYVSVGALFASRTKPEVPAIGLSLLRLIRERAPDACVVAIGGITKDNVESVLDTGIDGIAIARALLTGNTKKNCFTFRKIIDRRINRAGDHMRL
jgi:thiamine-phosphate pyrophosphorylase